MLSHFLSFFVLVNNRRKNKINSCHQSVNQFNHDRTRTYHVIEERKENFSFCTGYI